MQNDILKEYVARGTYIYPPRESMRLVTDLFAYCAARLPSWNTISISGYHIGRPGATAYRRSPSPCPWPRLRPGGDRRRAGGGRFCSGLSFFWNAHNHLFEEVARFRAAGGGSGPS